MSIVMANDSSSSRSLDSKVSSNPNRCPKTLIESSSSNSRGKKRRIEDNEGDESMDCNSNICGICLSESGKAIRGLIDCCDHYFCFVCIMEWSKVESLCPMCKKRFSTILRSTKSGVLLHERIFNVPVRDKGLNPIGNETNKPSDTYAQVSCTECHRSLDENLLLLCDLCDSAAHTCCVGLGATVPRGDWYCHDCTICRSDHTNSQIDSDCGNQDSRVFNKMWGTGASAFVSDIIQQSDFLTVDRSPGRIPHPEQLDPRAVIYEQSTEQPLSEGSSLQSISRNDMMEVREISPALEREATLPMTSAGLTCYNGTLLENPKKHLSTYVRRGEPLNMSHRSLRLTKEMASTSSSTQPQQIHSTAYERRRSAREQEVIPHVEEQEEEEHEETSEEGEEQEQHDEEKGGADEQDEEEQQQEEEIKEQQGEDQQSDDEDPFPGGPSDKSILKSFKTHVAFAIWNNEERRPLKCYNHALKIDEWKIKEECRSFRRRVKNSGLYNLVLYKYKSINRILVSSFVERWHQETNTFHLPFGEMTITIDDVDQLLDIPILGQTVRGNNVSYGEALRLVVDALGISEEDVSKEITKNRGFSVRMEWLRSKLKGVSEKATNHEKDCAVRGYLLYLLGCTIFADKTGTKVHVMYLRLLKDLKKVKDYAWGTAALTYLYRQLGYASRYGVRQITGYLPLLEAWVYEHFPALQPNPDLEFEIGHPRIKRWKPQPLQGEVTENSQVLRETLDLLHAEDVLWDPYADCRDTYSLNDVAFFSGCLRVYDIVEPYHPARCLRQFGHVQCIPPAPLCPCRAERGATNAAYRVVYDMFDQNWDDWDSHLLSTRVRGKKVVNPWDCVPEYIAWYHTITHQYVQNPTSRSGYKPQHQRIPTPNRGDNWTVYRDRALGLLKESFKLGQDQDIETMLERERQIYKFLHSDHRSPTTPTLLSDGEGNREIRSKKKEDNKVKKKNRARRA